MTASMVEEQVIGNNGGNSGILGTTVDPVTGSQRVSETDQPRFGMIPENLTPAANRAADTYYYPSPAGISMLGFKSLSLAGTLMDGGGAASVLTCEMRNIVTGLWIPVTIGIDTVTGAVASSLSSTTTPGTLFNWQFDDFNAMYFRFKEIVQDTTNADELTLFRTPI